MPERFGRGAKKRRNSFTKHWTIELIARYRSVLGRTICGGLQDVHWNIRDPTGTGIYFCPPRSGVPAGNIILP